MAAGSRWRRRDDVLWRRSLASVALLRPDADGGDPLVIGGSGVGVWELLDEPLELDDLAAELADLHHAEPGVVRRDVLALLTDLETRGFVERVSGPPWS